MKYIVTVFETHSQPYRIEANNPEQARLAVLEGEGELLQGEGEFIRVDEPYTVEGEKEEP